MRVLYLDCGMGAAGDMLSAALLELIEDKEKVLEELNNLGIHGVEYELLSIEKSGINGSKMSVKVHGVEEGDEHDHEHEHGHHHEHEHGHHHEHDHEHGHHHHHSLHDIHHMIDHMNIAAAVKEDIKAIYEIIARAESQVHGTTVEEVHFHEVGAMDAVADVAAVCILMDKLKADKIVVSPVHVGSGTVRCAHGILPVPAPATALILKDIPIYGGDIKGELCTPTGAALLSYFADEFATMPCMRVEKIGYGMGTKDFGRLNAVRAMLGEIANINHETKGKYVVELDCNVDDMTGEDMGFAIEAILAAGALEAFVTGITMKKSRPGMLLTVLTTEDKKEEVIKSIFTHTSTIGMRESLKRRYVLHRELVKRDTEFGPVRFKESTGFGVKCIKAEYEDISRIAKERGLSLGEVRDRIV